MAHKKNEFIPGVEGLRGIAILAVLLNHLDNALIPGGYLGVDLFFVISGFVVARSLDLAETKSLKNYLVEFYSKRLKRLFPALLVSILFIALLETFFFEGLGKSTVRTGGTALLGLSNLFLIHINTDYFGLGSEFNLFLPTWSLGIEEQFYFFFPLFLFWLKTKKHTITKFLFGVLAISFLTFVTSHFTSKNVQYYFPLSRLWELMCGSLLYFSTIKKSANFQNSLAIPTLLTLLFGVFFIPSQYFSVAAPIVCLLSVGLIYSSTQIDSKLLTNRGLMYVGKISYSLYLYHYAILKIINPGTNWLFRILSVVLVFAISMLSFYFIETPIRKKKLNKVSAKNVLIFAASITTFCLLIFAFTRRMPENDPFMHPTRDIYKIGQCNFIEHENKDCNLPSKGKPQLFFVGDSHSNALTPVMIKFHDIDQYEIYSLASAGVFTATMDGYTRKNVSKTAQIDTDFILKNIAPGSSVIVTNQLMTWFSHTLNDDPEAHRLTVEGKLLSQNEALERYIAEKRDFAKVLKSKSANLIITAPFPDFPLHPVKCYSPLRVTLNQAPLDNRCQTTRGDQEKRRKRIVEALKKLALEESNIAIFDPINLVCNEDSCKSYKNNKPVYYDDDHVNFNLSSDIYDQLSILIKHNHISSNAWTE